MLALLAIPLAVLALGTSTRPLPAPVKSDLIPTYWRAGCPVPLGQLRLLTVRHWGFDGKVHTGELVVNRDAAAPLSRVFAKLFGLRFPIRHLSLEDSYGPTAAQPKDGDVSGSFECRQASASPCSTATVTTHWSNHAYGLAIDLNPRENPYVGCSRTRNKASRPFLDRTRLRRGMVTPAVVAAFRSVGWGWGGSWSGDTKDYMHFSYNGH
jgi:hypothetical protein